MYYCLTIYTQVCSDCVKTHGNIHIQVCSYCVKNLWNKNSETVVSKTNRYLHSHCTETLARLQLECDLNKLGQGMGNATAYISSFSVTLGPTPFTWTIYCIYTGNFSIRLTSRFFFLSSRFTQSLGATNILKWGMFPFRYVFGKSVYNGAPLKSPDPLPGVRASWHLCHLWIFILLILFFFFHYKIWHKIFSRHNPFARVDSR